MGKNHPYSLEFMLKIKKVNPNFKFTGVDEENWKAFLESQKEDSLLDAINETQFGDSAEPVIEKTEKVEKPKKKRKSVKKVKQTIEPSSIETGEIDFSKVEKNETDEESA